MKAKKLFPDLSFKRLWDKIKDLEDKVGDGSDSEQNKNLQWFIDNGFLPNPNGIFVYMKGVFSNGQDIEQSNNNSATDTEIKKLVNSIEIKHTKSTTSSVDALGAAIFTAPIDVSGYKSIVVQYDTLSVVAATVYDTDVAGFALASNKDGFRSMWSGQQNLAKKVHINSISGSGYVATIDVSDLNGMYYLGFMYTNFDPGNFEMSARINSVTLRV